jgi:alpha-galactosidase
MIHRLPLCLLAPLLLTASLHAATVHLENIPLSKISSRWKPAQKNLAATKKPLGIGGVKFARGIGIHAPSECIAQLDGRATAFTAQVGVDDSADKPAASSIEFLVFGDGRELWKSGVCKHGEPPRRCKVDLAGIKLLKLVVTNAGDKPTADYGDWAEPTITYEGAAPVFGIPPAPKEDFVILTPPAPASPRINGPRVTALRPGSPFLFRIPCTGERPIAFSAKGLPEGIVLDPKTGILTGATKAPGTHAIQLAATNKHGTATRELRLVVGDTLALTPPMGWNSWYIHYNRVTEQDMRSAADVMIASGMADFGYQYVNIDDCWMKKKNAKPSRDENGDLLGNKKFPDIKGMVEHIHSLGLRAGTYISPGPWTCAGYVGSWQHEAQDAAWFARMGFDFLKYDWCSYGGVAGGHDLEHMQRPYKLMSGELRKQPRDIVLNLCQYGRGSVWEWGATVGNCWRTTGDLGLARRGGLPGFYSIGMSNAAHWEFAKPGGWNDPDYLLLGWVGAARGMKEGKKTTLTPNEQYSYMSMWSLMAAPLIFSGDMQKLDAFTLAILCNAEVIDIDQDPLGKQARIVRKNRTEFILAKPLEDGSTALGLFNLSLVPREISVDLAEIGIDGAAAARDLWRQKDLAPVNGTVTATVPRHGVYLVRLTPQ